jgi:hypothetical protein
VVLFDRQGHERELSSFATAIAWDGEQILIAAGRRVQAFGPDGRGRASYPADLGVTSVMRVGQTLALGFEDGNVLLKDATAGWAAGSLLESTPASPAVRMLAGPQGTLVVGFASGALGIWNMDDGMLLYRDKLHGPVVDLLFRAGALYAATELGDVRVLDLGVFHREYCEFLRGVWERVPTVWKSGKVTLQPPPAEHVCLQKS